MVGLAKPAGGEEDDAASCENCSSPVPSTASEDVYVSDCIAIVLKELSSKAASASSATESPAADEGCGGGPTATTWSKAIMHTTATGEYGEVHHAARCKQCGGEHAAGDGDDGGDDRVGEEAVQVAVRAVSMSVAPDCS